MTYGATGYLYVLLVLENKLKLAYESEPEKVEGTLKSLQDTIAEVVQLLVKACVVKNDQTTTSQSTKDGVTVNSETKKNRPYLRCEFYGEPYYGVAYGTVGLVYMLIKAVYAVPTMQGVQELMAAIEGSLHQILETMGDKGVLPIKQGEGAY